MISIVCAYALSSDGKLKFGYMNSLPWGKCTEDLDNFKKMTLGSVLIMGAKTFSSLPGLLPNRPHVVIRDTDRHPPLCKGKSADMYFGSLPEALEAVSENNEHVSIIGGAKLIEESYAYADRMVLTEIREIVESPADVFLTKLPKGDLISFNSIAVSSNDNISDIHIRVIKIHKESDNRSNLKSYKLDNLLKHFILDHGFVNYDSCRVSLLVHKKHPLLYGFQEWYELAARHVITSSSREHNPYKIDIGALKGLMILQISEYQTDLVGGDVVRVLFGFDELDVFSGEPPKTLEYTNF